MISFLLLTLLLTATTSLDVRTNGRQQMYEDLTIEGSNSIVKSLITSLDQNSTNASLSNSSIVNGTSIEGDSSISDGDGDGNSPMSKKLKEGGATAKLELMGAVLPKATSCPSNCYGNGFCINGECSCKQGYTGKNCAAWKTL
jgi:hypothetical protein